MDVLFIGRLEGVSRDRTSFTSWCVMFDKHWPAMAWEPIVSVISCTYVHVGGFESHL